MLIPFSSKDRISFQHSLTAANLQNLSGVFLQFQFGVDTAKTENNWLNHPNSKRKNQMIAFASGIGGFWKSNNTDNDVELNGCVVWDTIDDEYFVFITTDTTQTAAQIIKTYELRPEIEEDYRQLKDFWKIEDFKSTKIKVIAFHIICVLFGYLFFQLYTKLKDLIQNIETIEKEQLINPSDILVGEWLDTWMQEYKKNSIRPATYTSYHHSIEKHIRPAIGSIELKKLRPEHIQKLLNEMGKPHGDEPALAPWTILKAKNIISGALEQAARNHILIINPAKATIPPKLEQKDIRILTEAEQQKFMNACKGHRLESLYLLALATGMRRGEILALTWDCVDLKNQNITVKGSVSRIKDPDTGITELKFSEPKTKSGRRQVPILDNMVPILQAHKAMQDEEKAEAGSAWNPRNLVFCSNVGTTIEPRRVCTTLDKLAEKAGLPHFTFHAMRHTFATRMLEAEVPAKVVQDVLGHADVTLTLNTYSHVIGSTAHEQMAKINGLFKNKPSNQPSILKQLEEAKKQIKGTNIPARKKSKDGQEL